MAGFKVSHLIEMYSRWDSLNIFRYASARISNVDIVDQGTMDDTGAISVDPNKKLSSSPFNDNLAVSDLFTGSVARLGKKLIDGKDGFRTTYLLTKNTRLFLQSIRKNRSDPTIKIHYSFIILNTYLTLRMLLSAAQTYKENNFKLEDIPIMRLEPYVDLFALLGKNKEFQSVIDKIESKQGDFADNSQFTQDIRKATVKILSRVR